MLASRDGRLHAVGALLSSGRCRSLEAKAKDGWTALHLAAAAGHESTGWPLAQCPPSARGAAVINVNCPLLAPPLGQPKHDVTLPLGSSLTPVTGTIDLPVVMPAKPAMPVGRWLRPRFGRCRSKAPRAAAAASRSRRSFGKAPQAPTLKPCGARACHLQAGADWPAAGPSLGGWQQACAPAAGAAPTIQRVVPAGQTTTPEPALHCQQERCFCEALSRGSDGNGVSVRQMSDCKGVTTVTCRSPRVQALAASWNTGYLWCFWRRSAARHSRRPSLPGRTHHAARNAGAWRGPPPGRASPPRVPEVWRRSVRVARLAQAVASAAASAAAT